MVTAGTMFLIWIGELMTEKNLGNGVSLLIFAGILADLPSTFVQTAATLESTQVSNTIIFIAIALITIVGVVHHRRPEARADFFLRERIRGMKQYGGVDTHLPLRVNLGGVIPINFRGINRGNAAIGGSIFINSPSHRLAGTAAFINKFSIPAALFILFFIFFWFCIYIFLYGGYFPSEPNRGKLQKQGGFVPGIRPGHQTPSILITRSIG